MTYQKPAEICEQCLAGDHSDNAELMRLLASVREQAKRQAEEQVLELKRLKLERRAKIRALRRAGLEVPIELLHGPKPKRQG